jgi:hypothetical protein
MASSSPDVKALFNGTPYIYNNLEQPVEVAEELDSPAYPPDEADSHWTPLPPIVCFPKSFLSIAPADVTTVRALASITALVTVKTSSSVAPTPCLSPSCAISFRTHAQCPIALSHLTLHTRSSASRNPHPLFLTLPNRPLRPSSRRPPTAPARVLHRSSPACTPAHQCLAVARVHQAPLSLRVAEDQPWMRRCKRCPASSPIWASEGHAISCIGSTFLLSIHGHTDRHPKIYCMNSIYRPPNLPSPPLASLFFVLFSL